MYLGKSVAFGWTSNIANYFMGLALQFVGQQQSADIDSGADNDNAIDQKPKGHSLPVSAGGGVTDGGKYPVAVPTPPL